MLGQAVTGGVIFKNVGVAAPVQGSFDLVLGFIAGEMLVQDVAEKFQRHGVIRFAVKDIGHLLEQRDMGQHSVAEQGLARGNIGFGESFPFRA